MNNPLIVPFIESDDLSTIIPVNAARLTLQNCNWENEFPYKPATEVALWHNGSNLFIHYDVDEKYILASCGCDNDKVSNDSCVEFFISFDNDGYYNLEANCIGRILLSHRKSRKENVVYADSSTLENISRVATLGNDTFEMRNSEGKWGLILKIPVSTFFKHSFDSFKGLKGRCNIYKCGDHLPVPHYLSWAPIDTPSPDFHRPEFFGQIIFENN